MAAGVANRYLLKVQVNRAVLHVTETTVFFLFFYRQGPYKCGHHFRGLSMEKYLRNTVLECTAL